jgi:hypothetical protein
MKGERKIKYYGCAYRFEGDNTVRTIEFRAKNENEARLMMMRFAEMEEVYVQNLGRAVSFIPTSENGGKNGKH